MRQNERHQRLFDTTIVAQLEVLLHQHQQGWLSLAAKKWSDEDREQEIWSVPPPGGDDSRVRRLEPAADGFCASPDSNQDAEGRPGQEACVRPAGQGTAAKVVHPPKRSRRSRTGRCSARHRGRAKRALRQERSGAGEDRRRRTRPASPTARPLLPRPSSRKQPSHQQPSSRKQPMHPNGCAA